MFLTKFFFNLIKKNNKYIKIPKTLIPFVQSPLPKSNWSRSFRGDWTKGITVYVKLWNILSGFFCSSVYLLSTHLDSLLANIITELNNILTVILACTLPTTSMLGGWGTCRKCLHLLSNPNWTKNVTKIFYNYFKN